MCTSIRFQLLLVVCQLICTREITFRVRCISLTCLQFIPLLQDVNPIYIVEIKKYKNNSGIDVVCYAVAMLGFQNPRSSPVVTSVIREKEDQYIWWVPSASIQDFSVG